MSPRISPQKKQLNKLHIAEKALETFKQHGYHKTSMSMIAKELGWSKGGLYAYFDSKESLFIHILQHLLDEKSYLLTKEFQTNKAYDQLIEQWNRIFDSWKSLDAKSLKLTFEFWLEASENDDYKEKLLNKYKSSEKYFTEIIEFGIKNGEFNTNLNPALITQLFWSLIDGQVQIWVARNHQPTEKELDELFTQLTILLTGVRADER